MAKRIFAANKLTGGTAGCLDDINHNAIEDGNLAVVINSVDDAFYCYRYEASSTESESSPTYIKPDSNSGNGCWVLSMDTYTIQAANNVEQATTVVTGTNVEVANTVTTGTNVASAVTVTTGTNVEAANTVTTGTNVEAADLVEVANSVDAASSANTVTTANTVTQATTVTNSTNTSVVNMEDEGVTASAEAINQIALGILSLIGNSTSRIVASTSAGAHYLGLYPSASSGPAIFLYGASDSGAPGTIRLVGYDGSDNVGLTVADDGTVNIPIGLQLGGVAVAATAAEISELNGQGAVAADFAKLHAISSSASDIDTLVSSSLYTSFSPGGDLTGTIYLARVGRLVTMTWANLTHASDNSPSSSFGILPSGYRPYGTDINNIYFNFQNSRRVYVSGSGIISFYYYDYTGTAVALTGTGPGTVSWVSEEATS